MKRFQLLSILILLISFVGVQSVVGQVNVTEDYKEVNGIYYSAYISDTKEIYYYTSLDKEEDDFWNDVDKRNYTINFKYPASSLSFDAQSEYDQNTQIRIKYYTNNTWSRWWTTGTINKQTRTGGIFSGYKYHDNYGTYTSSQNIPDINSRSIEFEKNTYYLQRFYVDIKNVKLKMAPHILLNTITMSKGATNQSTNVTQNTNGVTSSATINFGEMRYDAGEITATISIKSLLATGTLTTTLSNNPSSCFTISNAPNADGSKATFYELNTKSFTIKLDPSKFKDETESQEITEEITISGAGTGNDVVITLTATVNPPQTQTISWNQTEFNKTLRVGDKITLKATATSNLDVTYKSNNDNATISGKQMTIVKPGPISITASQNGDANFVAAKNVTKDGLTAYEYNVSNLKSVETAYKYVKLSWAPIHEADSYSVYDANGNLIGKPTTETTFTISTDITYGTTYTFKVKTNDDGSYTKQSEGTEITITTPNYPSVTGITFPQEHVSQNSFTATWNSVTVLSNNHRLVEYHVRLYKGNTQIGETKRTTETSYFFDGLVDASDYRVCVNVEYEYTLNGSTINVQPDANYWSCKDVTTASFVPTVSQGGFDDVERVQGEWYRIKVNSTEGIDITDKTYTITLYYPCNSLSYQAWLSAEANGEHTVSVDATNETTNIKDYTSGKRYSSEKDIKTNITQITFTGKNAILGKNVYVDNIYAKIAPHIEFDSPTTKSLGDVEIGSTARWDIDFKSFLAMGNITITSSDEQFLIGGTLKEKTIQCGANYLCKNTDNSHNFSITFTPKSPGSHSAIITITDGTTTKEININANCIKRTPTITWTEDRQIAPEQIVLDAATSDCGSTITYTSDNESVIRVENNGTALIAVGIGTANITATTAGNDTWKETSATTAFEVTDKTLQSIIWDQNLSLLKLGDTDTTLNAYTITKETGEANNRTITYSVANSNIVSISNGILSIKGLGITTITATQTGDNNFATISMTKTVIVRNVAENCNNNLALTDNGKSWSKGNWDWDAVSHTCNLSTVGENLTFTTTKTEGLLPTTGDNITVTDEHGAQFFSGDLGTTKTVKINRNTTKLTFTLKGNRTIGISEITVTPAIYLETKTNEIVFPNSEYGKRGNASISFDWANQPDYAWAVIENDNNGVFSVDPNTYIFGGSCGSHGTSTVKLFFNPTRLGDFSADLVVYVGEGDSKKKMSTTPITATAIRAPQFITWLQDLNPTLNLPEYNKYTLNAIASSGLDVIYISSNESVARIENGQLVIVGAGEATITATQPGNDNYEAAGNVTKTISVAKLDQTISWEQDITNVIIDGTYPLTATASSGLDITYTSSNESVVKIVNGNQMIVVGVGEVTITANQAGNANYNSASASKTLTVEKRTQTITWNQEFNKTLRIGDIITLTSSATSTMSVSYTSSNNNIATINGNQMTIVGAGEVTITASQSGNNAWEQAENVTKTITTYQYNVSNLKSTETAYKYVKLTWEAIEGADSYTIFDGATLVGTTTETNITITGLDHASTHTYTIKTNDADSYTPQSTGSTITITTLSYPKTDAGNVTTVNVNDFTIQWNQVTPALNHELIEYIIRLYKENESNYTEYSSTNTSYTISGLIDHTQYTVYIGVRYRQNLDNAEFTPTKDNDWYKIDVSTPSIITSEPHDGVQMDKGVWYRVNLNNKIDISDGSAGSGFETKQNPYIMSLNYPCENNFKYKFSASDFADTWGTATLRIQESTNESKDTPSWIPITNNNPKEVHKEDEDGTASTSNGANVKRLEFYENTGSDGKANGKAYISDIWVEIVPHILLKETRYVKEFTNETATQTTNAIIDFGTIEIGSSKAVTIDFKSFLSKGNIRAELTNNTNKEIFWLNSIRGTTVLPIAENNTLKQINTDDHKFTISFNPDRANERDNPNDYFEGTLIIKDEQHTVTITLKGKCIKKTPEISWINDKYINLGDFLAGAATSTYGSVTYTSNDSDIIGVNGSLLEGKAVGNTTIVASVAETSTYYAATTEPTTFYVTDRILQAIEWNQDFTSLTTDTENINLTAQSIVRETNEYSNNPITYSSANSNIVEIVDGNKLKVNNSGYTTITAHQEGNDEYAPTYMTKIVFIRNASGGCTDLLNNITEKQYGDVEDGAIWDAIVGGWDWGPFTFEQEWNTVADKLSFTTSKHSSSTSHHLTITDDLGNIVYDDELGKSVTDLQLDRNARKLTFELKGNLRVAISDIGITPAIYIESETNEINFSSTEVDLIAIEEVSFNWANQPDYIWVKIVDDTEGVFSVDNKTAIFGSTNCGDYGTSTVKVLFSPKEQKNDYSAKLAVYVDANLDEPALEIPITGIGAKAKQEISWINSSPSTVDNHINLARTTASRQQPITYTLESGDNIVRFNDDNTITILNEGTFILSAQQEGNNSYEPTNTITKEFTATIGTIQFDKDGEWNSVNNWKPVSVLNRLRNVLPSAVVNAEIVADAAMTDVDGVVNNLSIVDGGTLTIGATSGLKANAVSGATATNLILEASAEGNAAFAYVSGAPNATVKMHSKASGGVAGGTPQWQYMGVAVNKVDENNCAKASNFSGAWLLKWKETDNITGDPWSDKPLPATTPLVPWAGYSITQPDTTTYTMSGQLMNSNQTYQLTRTIKKGADKQDPDCGFNLLANSYTAPIDITKLDTSNFVKADACIVLYNTGTYADWDSLQGKSGEAPGQLTVIPVESARAIAGDGLPTTIASMQAFFVMARDTGATFTVDYQRAVAGATNHGNQMRAPEMRDEFNVLKIMIKGENSRDHLFLLENEKTTKAYDNGYEARKIFDAPRGHQMYATCEYGYASIDCSESFVGQTIGLKGDSEGEQLTISFDTDRLEGYSSLYLYDKVTGDYVNIIAGEEYTFYGIRGADDNRFTIVTNPDDRNQTPPFVVIGNELAFDKSQIGTDNANIYIYDAVGRLLMTDKVNPGENYRIPDMPEGIYLVSMNGYTTKIVRK